MAIGDLVGTLSESGVGRATFTITSNPGQYFNINGNSMVEANTITQNGIYTISLIATGISIPQQFVLEYIGGFPIPPPPPPPLTSTISSTPTTVFAGQTALISITWNDAVINFTLPAFSVTNGTIGSLTQVDATHFTAIFTPSPGIMATADISDLGQRWNERSSLYQRRRRGDDSQQYRNDCRQHGSRSDSAS